MYILLVYTSCVSYSRHGMQRANDCRHLSEIFQKNWLELLKATLSQCYHYVNTVIDYCAVEVYLHAFITTALHVAVPLI
jgi:hypothetical protein